jgi:hypothetical protein
MTVTLRRQEALFTMSAFSGLLAIRRYAASHPEIQLPDVVKALKHLSVDDAYHDYEAALMLHDRLPERTPADNDVPVFFRYALALLAQDAKPWWLRLSLFGRDRVKAALSLNEVQCFEAAGLFSSSPTTEILEWWDTLAQGVRSANDSERLAQGRKAEKLTIDYETQRLSALGITNRPRWIALDDNAAGYDVHSYEKGQFEPIAKLIEVKSCSRHPTEIFITRNEWDTAIERAPHYCFHIWILPEKELVELTPTQIGGHIPDDRGNGRWQIAKITLRET